MKKKLNDIAERMKSQYLLRGILKEKSGDLGEEEII